MTTGRDSADDNKNKPYIKQMIGIKTIVGMLVIVIFLCYICCTNHGRYLRCKSLPIYWPYAINYSSIPLFKGAKRVVITLTSTPETASNLKTVLNSLLSQTVRVSEIALNVPYKFKVPEGIELGATVFRTGKDAKPLDGILPTIKREGEAGTIIVAIDDKHVYGKDFIETIIQESMDSPDMVVYVNGESQILALRPEMIKPEILYDDKTSNLENYLTAKTRGFDYTENYKL